MTLYDKVQHVYLWHPTFQQGDLLDVRVIVHDQVHCPLLVLGWTKPSLGSGVQCPAIACAGQSYHSPSVLLTWEYSTCMVCFFFLSGHKTHTIPAGSLIFFIDAVIPVYVISVYAWWYAYMCQSRRKRMRARQAILSLEYDYNYVILFQIQLKTYRKIHTPCNVAQLTLPDLVDSPSIFSRVRLNVLDIF